MKDLKTIGNAKPITISNSDDHQYVYKKKFADLKFYMISTELPERSADQVAQIIKTWYSSALLEPWLSPCKEYVLLPPEEIKYDAGWFGNHWTKLRHILIPVSILTWSSPAPKKGITIRLNLTQRKRRFKREQLAAKQRAEVSMAQSNPPVSSSPLCSQGKGPVRRVINQHSSDLRLRPTQQQSQLERSYGGYRRWRCEAAYGAADGTVWRDKGCLRDEFGLSQYHVT